MVKGGFVAVEWRLAVKTFVTLFQPFLFAVEIVEYLLVVWNFGLTHRYNASTL